MDKQEIKALFDQQAAGYDTQWARMQPLRDCLYLLLDAATCFLVSQFILDRMRRAYAHDVAVLPPGEVAAMLRDGGFPLPVPFFQAGLMHGWISRCQA